MSEYTLSYIVVTFNKLPYLKEMLANVISNRQPDEEIIVIDGGSSDGTPAYLEELKKRGDIQQYVSEKDRGQSHGINKGMLRARGTILKVLNDDDTYYFDAIRKCKEFMLEHPEVDAMGSNGISHNGQDYHREEDFMLWKTTPYHPFMITEQGLLLRRDSISVFGLADTSVVFWEWEFTMRLTSGKAKLAWYTGKTFKHVFNEDSISVKRAELWAKESAEMRRRYPGIYCTWCHYVPEPLRELIRRFVPKKRLATPEQSDIHHPTFLM